jgi:hypothetical protein
MKKINYSIINQNNNNIDIVFYIFGDGISTNLNPDWTTYGYFRFYQIGDYLDFLNEQKDSYNNYPQHVLNYNSSASFSADKVIADIQQLYKDNKLEYPKEKADFIKKFDDANMMQLVAFQTENQELIKWFCNLNGENTDSALAGNLALTDDTLALLLKRNAYKYIPFINKNRHFSKQILDLLIKIDKNLVSELALTKNIEDNTLCYILPYANNDVFYDLVVSTSPPQYMLEFIAYHILEKEDDACNIGLINYYQPELNFIANSLYQLASKSSIIPT